VNPDTRDTFISKMKAIGDPAARSPDRERALRELKGLATSSLLPHVPIERAPEEPSTQHVLPLAVVSKTRGYFKSVVLQANGCYENGWYDGCSVMIRKLVEILILEVYEAHGRSRVIQDARGLFLMLGDMIAKLLADTTWNLARDSRVVLPKIKRLGDRAAHNRRYLATRQDVDQLLSGLRVLADDLLHLAGLK